MRSRPNRALLIPTLSLLTCLPLLLTGCGNKPPAVYQHLRLSGDDQTLVAALDGRRWVIGERRSDKGRTIVEYLPEGQSRMHWSESVGGVYRADPPSAKPSVAQQFDNFTSGMRSLCPNVHVDALEQTPDQIIYRMRLEHCEMEPDQSEIGRIVRGESGIFRIAYRRKGPPLPHADEQAWRDRLAAARVVESETRETLGDGR